MSKTVILNNLIFIGIVLFGLSQNNDVFSQTKTDSLTKLSTTYMFEDPQRAQQISKELIKYSKLTNEVESVIKSYLLYAESCINQNNFEQAQLYIDSANTLSQKNNLKSQIINCIILSGKKSKKSGDDDRYLQKLAEAKKFAIVSKLNVDLIKIELFVGDYNKTSGKYEESVALKKKTIEFANKTGIKPIIADCWNSLGSTFWYYSHFTEALESYYKSLIIREETNDTLGIIASLKNLGLTHRDLSNFDKALSHLNQALKLSFKIKNESETADVLNLLGSLHFRFNRYNESILYYKQSIEIRNKNGYLNTLTNTLENLARAYIQKSQFDDALGALNQALEIREQLLDQQGISATQNEIGNLYNQKGNIAEALRRYLLSLRIRQKIGHDQDIAKSLTNIGLTYRKLGSLNNATNYLEQARKLVLTGQDPSEAAYVLVNLGNLYIDQKQYELALKVFQEALAMRKKTGDEASIARTYRNIAQAQIQIQQFDKARNNLNHALKIFQKQNDGRAIADTYNDLGNLERQSGKIKLAIKHFETASKIYDESANFDGKALCLRKIGEIQIGLGLLAEAEKNITQSISIGVEMGNLVLVHYGYKAKHDYYIANKNYKSALEYYSKHIKIRDSIENARNNEKNLEAQLDLELDKKKEEIKTMESEVQVLKQEALLNEIRIEKQKTIQYFLILVSLLILALSVTLYYVYRQKLKHNQNLKDKISIIRETNDKLLRSEKDLKLTVKTKDKLFSIIAHDLKSPFTALIGLTEILSSKIENLSNAEIKEFSTLINQSSQKVHTLIENLLNWARSQTGGIKLSPELINLKSIVDSCFETISLSANEKDIKLVSKLTNHDIAYVDSETIKTVIRNLISNAIKFTPNNGKISISSKKEEGKINIFITDTGIGIPSNDLSKLFKIEGTITTKGTNQETGTGLGLIICKEFVEKNNGEIEVESEINVGTTFKISLPIEKS
ncbi:MAG: tetratricopeptide repeat protein [Tenuifilaceae bacterium]